MKRLIPFIGVVCSLLIVSCEKKVSAPSSVAQVTSLTLSADSFPSLSKVRFTVEERNTLGHIYNPDSVPFGIRLDSVCAKFTFYTTPSSAVLRRPDTVITLSGADTLNFYQLLGPDTLVVTSADGSTVKEYLIDVNWHRVDPDLFVWERICDHVYASSVEAMQQLIVRDDELLLYTNDGVNTRLYTSDDDGYTWSMQSVEGLPASCRVRSIVSLEEGLYYAADSYLYLSTDGVHWTAEDYSSDEYTFLTSLFAFPDEAGVEHPWVLVRKEGTDSCFLSFVEHIFTGMIVPIQAVESANFPVSGFSAVRFVSSSARSRMMLYGGYDEDGKMVNSRWNLEYSPAVGLRITDYAIEYPSFPRVANSSLVWYNHRLLLFGAVDSTYQYLGKEVYFSEDEGVSWQKADTAKCALPAPYYSRKNVTSQVAGEYVYVVGGSDRTTDYSDVFRGRINSVGWEEY